jgi:ferritin
MMNPTVQTALNKQIADEHFSSLFYLSMASWCDHKGLPGAAAFLYAHADEERDHMLKLVHYVNDMGGHARIEGVASPPAEFESLKAIFLKLQEHEQAITRKINTLTALCWEEKDLGSFNFLQWFLAEQREEETLVRGVLDKLNLIGDDPSKLFWIDKELAELATAPADPLA